MRRITRGWHRAVAALVAEGNDVIADDLWIHRWWWDDWREALAAVKWWSVRLTASPGVLAERERIRGDRPVGLAAEDHELSSHEAEFDLVIDTDIQPAEEAAAAIARLMERS